MDFYHDLIETKNTKEDIINFLTNLAISHDGDLAGNCGDDYIWDAAINAGFDGSFDKEGVPANLKYLISVAEKENTPETIIKSFFDTWFEHDFYWQQYRFSIIEKNDMLYIAYAIIAYDD